MAAHGEARGVQQNIQYCTAADGVRLAYSIVGKGPRLVRTSHWFSHLEHDLTSPIFRPVIIGLAERHELLRYDARGVGLSQRDVVEVSFEKFVQDLETVTDAAKFERFVLLGLSQGCAQAIAYAARHPERVSHLILYGGFARGSLHRDNPEKQRETVELSCALIRNGWGSNEESHRQFFTSQFIPDAEKELQHSLNETQRLAATPEMAERFLRANAEINVSALLAKIQAPTLILHPTGDLRVPFSLGQELAAAIPGAKLVPLESNNHMLDPNEPASRAMGKAIAEFLGEKPVRMVGVSDRLENSARALEQHWLIKFVLIFAAITGSIIFFLEMWKMAEGH
jgi:pimeloyl-ACP methyl ester carboxylesterase